MKDNPQSHAPFTLTRRSVLAGLGGVGLASAGAGLGTTALFSDREDFTGNELTAGEFDLKVDWQQSYYSDRPGEVRDDPSTWQLINAFPDANNDDLQDTIRTRDEIAFDEFSLLYNQLNDTQTETVEGIYRAQFADAMDDLTMPLIELDDVKPGDEGEVTISMHLFDNPGYIWLGGSLTENAENGVTEPESKDPDEDDPLGPASGSSSSGELADEIMTRIWYDDDCDNRFDEGRPCIQLVIDNTDSMGDTGFGNPDPLVGKDERLLTELESWVERLDTEDGGTTADGDLSPASVGLTYWGEAALTGTPLTPTTVKSDVIGVDNGDFATSTGLQKTDYQAGGSNPDIANAIDEGAAALATCPVDDTRIMVLVTNGVNVSTPDFLTAANNNLRLNGGEVDRYVIVGLMTYSSRTVLESIEGIAGNHEFIFVPEGTQANFQAAINGPDLAPSDPDSSLAAEVGFGTTSAAEQVIAEGTLRQVLTGFNPDGTPYTGTSIQTPSGYPLDGDRGRSGRNCYPNSNTRCIALKWWLPADHANEIQSDSVAFDVNLYAEQCRHNDGTTADPFA